MDSLRFGPAGIPRSTPESGINAAAMQVRKLGLDCMELEFVRNVYLTEKTALSLGEVAKKNDIILTCHGSYYLNLNAKEKLKAAQSRARILSAAKMAWLAGGYSVTFHASYYLDSTPEQCYEKTKAELKAIVKKLKDEGNKIWIRPETTGKGSQFGTVDEILKLSNEIEQVMPCIDFSHLHARSAGKENTLKEFENTLEKVEKHLGKEGLNNMHIHVSGIEYTAKGERNHLNLPDSDMNYKDLVKSWKEFKIKGCVISESPNLEGDALLLQKLWNK
jgi:deoxyribonuclease-4